MQPPYRPQAPTAASQPPAFDPYSQEQLAYAPGAPSLPPTTPAPTETGKLRKTPSRSQPVSQLTTPGAHQQQPGPFRNHPGPPPQPAPVGQLPERPTDAMPPQFHVSGPIRPMLQQRPSQRSHVRFESPSRPEVRPPLKQGSVDEAYDGMEMPGPPPLPVAHNAPPPQQPPPPPQEDKSPPLPQKPQSRPGSMYMTSSRNGSALPRPDIPLPPRRPVPSVQTPLPPRHLPKQLVMPAPLQPLEDQRKAEVARLAQQHRAQAIPQERRSEEGPVRYPDIHTHDGRYMLHHSMSHRQSPVAQVPERATVTRAASQGQNRAQSVHSSAGPNVLRKRSVNSASTPLVGPDAAASNTTAAMFAARVVDDSPKGKTVERVASGVWARDRVREEEIQRELAREQKVERKLSKLTRRLR
ncbi:uncharacterized protein B0H18DRAFT_969696 [Fomitopsis serialis]|uniref:uncharacterized protein n=1 Tax=Fomitopsis serialis TaxID=139415 RepID=UPI002008B3C6|nr:uncharacterized protein B0H18DRAFT_969696 [Neoantrodia serialis]KAH9937234.1 hypothetical protein B0H18DRAFT_969696 [Neoantrodia serialis]